MAVIKFAREVTDFKDINVLFTTSTAKRRSELDKGSTVLHKQV